MKNKIQTQKYLRRRCLSLPLMNSS